MAFHYREIVPWGRSYAEYLAMFALSSADLEGSLLGCADGPASFNAEHTRRGGQVVSVDPLYRFGKSAIERRIEETYEDVIGQTRRERHRFVWNAFATVDELGAARMAAMRAFLGDYSVGRKEGRYLAAGLPHLPFPDRRFDLALCAHLLFFYTEHLDLGFHRASLVELCRTAREVRVFPLVDTNGDWSPVLDAARWELDRLGIASEVRRVAYEFQRGGNQMLVIGGG